MSKQTIVGPICEVGIRLEIQVVQLQIMEKQIFKHNSFTLSTLGLIFNLRGGEIQIYI